MAPAIPRPDPRRAASCSSGMAGPWAHRYDVLPRHRSEQSPAGVVDTELGPSESATHYQSFTATNLVPGTTYYWRVVSRTMANLSKNGDTWSFTTAGTAPPPSLHRHRPETATSSFTGSTAQSPGPSGRSCRTDSRRREAALEHERERREDHDGLAHPASYVDFTFNAFAGMPYHLWIRGRAEGNVYTNDSVFVQFSNAVTAAGGRRCASARRRRPNTTWRTAAAADCRGGGGRTTGGGSA